MHNPNPNPNTPSSPSPPPVLDMESTSIWDWSQFLDFNIDDELPPSPTGSHHSPLIFPTFQELPADDGQLPPPPPPPPPPVDNHLPLVSFPIDSNSNSNSNSNSINNNNKVRKRDPRATCPNFLAGRIPCACPELDAQLAAEEEEAGPGKKRAKSATAARVRAVANVRCQVPGCEVDISGLKGYHKRHRVCLRCAHASSVVLDGHSKRYCQQCGKFHFLSDFDEGKRSCRRKLEKHNDRRRRKPANSKGSAEKEGLSDSKSSAEKEGLSDSKSSAEKEGLSDSKSSAEKEGLSDSKGSAERELQSVVDCDDDDEAGKVTRTTSREAAEVEALLLAAEGGNSGIASTHGLNIHNESILSFVASGETQTDSEKGKLSHSHSLSYGDDKSAFSSVCPTGRISFKLYDWNPAEFPRRLRHQIFQWLGSMPVELEGYIRPGCTILTLFISMPRFMWVKLSEDPVVCIQDLLSSPRNMLSGRGNFFVHLNNLKFSVMKDGLSVIKVEVKEEAPRLHYVHPTCFEAGKPMELVACGSNLLQPKFRFLVSFAGKYLTNDVRVSPLCNKTKSATNLNHQYLNISVSRAELDVHGPGFVEVENESGLSNFIPILIADKEICAEIKSMQTKFYSIPNSGDSQSASMNFCEVAVLRRHKLSELLLDMAWLLKEPVLEDIEYAITSSHLQRFTCVLNFLIEYDSTTVLNRVLHGVKVRINRSLPTGGVETDRTLFQGTMNHATEVLRQRLHLRDLLPEGNDQTINQDLGLTASSLAELVSADSVQKQEAVPLLNAECIMSVRLSKEQLEESCSRMFYKTNRFLTPRPLIFVITSAAVCFAICTVVFLPHKATGIKTTIRRCLFGDENS